MAGAPAHICIFEDAEYPRLLPLVYFRPVCNLRVGILSLKEKIVRRFPRARVTLHCRPYLADYMRLRNPGMLVNEIPQGTCLLINGRTVLDDTAAAALVRRVTSDTVFFSGTTVVAARLSGKNLDRVRTALAGPITPGLFDGIARAELDVRTVRYPWELVHANGPEIVADTAFLRGRRKSPVSVGSFRTSGAHFRGVKNITIGKGTTIGPGAVIDASDGPVTIGEQVRIFPHATIIGPVFIGNGSSVKVDAQIYPNTSIGPVCKVGGEIEDTIIHGYSNKQHAGFIGHSYIGAWVNLGAGTSNSDLKSNYGLVRVQMGSDIVETGEQFVGLTLGDHSKTAINSMFNTGTIVGVCSNIFGFGFPPKHVPSFSWGAAGETFTTFSIDRAIDMARRVMSRRGIALTEQEVRLFRTIFELTADQRKRAGMPA